MEPKDKRVTDLTNLIQGMSKGINQEGVEELLKFSTRIFNSYIGSNSNQDIQILKQKIIQKVQKVNNNDNKKALKAQQLLEKILKSKTLNKKSQTIKLLLKLSDPNQASNDSFQVYKSRATNHKVLNTTADTTNMNSTFVSLKKPIPDQLAIIRYRGSAQHGITQTEILRQISFVMQNITGNLINVERDFYSLKPLLNISDPVRKITRQLCQIGWLFKKIMSKIQQQGTVRDAFNIAIRQEMNQYYRWIALIQNMTKSEELTLRKLVLWSFQPYQRLKWIAIISEAITPYNGCKIISIINSYRPQGNPAIMQLLNRILNHIIQPLLKFIYLWIYKGQLHDPLKQYFIFDDINVPLSQLWQDKYKIIQDLIPNLIDQQSALMIFNTGKTINFLKKCCNHDYQIDVEFIDHKNLLHSKHSQFTNVFSNTFKDWLVQVSQKANKQLIKVLFNKFKLKMHLDALKRFLLMGQGEFIHNLMDFMSEQLSKPSHSIYKYNLDALLESAIRTSNAQYLNQQILNRLSIKLFEQGNEGWDIFSLDYIIDSPLSTLLTPEVMKSYLRIFNFLWKVKRVDHFLNQVWLNHAKQTAKAKQYMGIFHFCHLLRNAMMHFVTNIYGYIMIAIEAAWKNFIDNLDTASNFHEVIKMHQSLINELLDITFLTLKNKNINQSLFNVFQLIFRYKISQDKLLDDYREYFERLRQFENRKKTKYLMNTQESSRPVFSTDSFKKIKEMNDLYQKAFKQFSSLIKKEEQKLTFLNFRLDFSQYYAYLFVKKHYLE